MKGYYTLIQVRNIVKHFTGNAKKEAIRKKLNEYPGKIAETMCPTYYTKEAVWDFLKTDKVISELLKKREINCFDEIPLSYFENFNTNPNKIDPAKFQADLDYYGEIR